METHKYLVVQTAFIGDCILTLPLVQKIFEKNNNVKIDILTTPQCKEIFELSPYVNEIIIYDKKNKHKSLKDTYFYAKQLSKKNYDIIVSPHRSFRSSILSFLIGGKERISFDKSSFSFLYTKKVKYQANKHEIQRNLSLLSCNLEDNDLKKLKCNLILEKNFIEKYTKDERKKIAIAPGSVWETKRYPLNYFIEIIDFLMKNEYIIFLIGSNSEKYLANKIKEYYPKIIDLTGELTLKETFYLLKDIDLLIANDSAPTHMGALMDINVLTLYCSTVPEFGFYPFNEKGYYLSESISCKPCGIHGYKSCPQKHFKCALELTPMKVINKINQIIYES
ncbi:MAG TPA: glycosyltransferase family 9 protein [Ignavibacteriales bacterium]|nr:glycosyltransferase family 9 protein [Ignavibacteriales bacterium]HOL80993.1 glycosyltransferase family 9 protein [Ignavibacteriales bacterium]HOM64729.1 glycosyltransferase family 9 protein [Ignavibacteriales bacterium]HPD66739.1 glycosyltransferase family 9 protein [Ignavibacteriales bacterium]HPP32773.1 glycosyltransferase family 9 protein [Ignavibacteriales bacterium]